MPRRRIPVFFYGLFMDAALLRARGIDPVAPRRACARGYALRIAGRATLVPEDGGRTTGVVMDLTHDDLARLYADPDVAAYRPEAALVELDDGSAIAALTFTQPDALTPATPASEAYALALERLRRSLDLPPGW
jgi:hypothetical protein